MNIKLIEFKEYIKNKRVAVIGIGVSNRPLIKFLVDIGVNVTAFDKCNEETLGDFAEELKNLNIEMRLGEDYLSKLIGFEVIFRTPGMRYDIPELLAEKDRGANITSEMEVFVDICPAKIFAITGSDGKTTTTTLTYKLLEKQGYKCWLGGNIGTPLLSRIEEIQEEDFVVLELSSFQLHTMKKSPEVAVVTNITPNHLDVHKSMDEYVEAKRNILCYQGENDLVVLNYDNDITRAFAESANAKVRYFSRLNELSEGLCVSEGYIVAKFNGEVKKLVKCDDILIPGKHNIENYLAACAAIYEYITPETVEAVATSFTGVEHRIEFVREFNGVKFYNSSIDSSPNRTKAALNTFDKKVILIAGGKDKNIPYDELGPSMVENVKELILIGSTADKIHAALKQALNERNMKEDSIKVHRCNTYKELVEKSREISTNGDIVILSPASTSFDMFRNFEERGKLFKKLVMELE